LSRSNSCPEDANNNNSKHNSLQDIPEKQAFVDDSPGLTTTTTKNDLTVQKGTEDDIMIDSHTDSQNKKKGISSNQNVVEQKQNDDDAKQTPTTKKKHHHHHTENLRCDSEFVVDEISHPHHHQHHHHRSGEGDISNTGSDSEWNDDDNDDDEKEITFHLDSRYMSIKKDDLATLYVQFQLMREAQKEVQQILRKYKKKLK
jgi:hypothetical protein